MDKLKPHDALTIAERDTVPVCASCTSHADDGKEYCWHCETYWEDVEEGLFDYDYRTEATE